MDALKQGSFGQNLRMGKQELCSFTLDRGRVREPQAVTLEVKAILDDPGGGEREVDKHGGRLLHHRQTRTVSHSQLDKVWHILLQGKNLIMHYSL